MKDKTRKREKKRRREEGKDGDGIVGQEGDAIGRQEGEVANSAYVSLNLLLV